MELVGRLRGGATAVEEEEEEDEEDEQSNIVLVKLRNIIRSLMAIGERKSPTLAKVMRKILLQIEGLLSVQLLPSESKQQQQLDEIQVESKTIKKKKKKKNAISEKTTKSAAKSKSASKKKKKTTKSKKPSAAQQHLDTKLSSTNPNYRIQMELKEFIKSPPSNLSVRVGSNMRIWIVTMVGAKNTIYEGEKYKLRIQFPKQYPVVPPSVYFLPPVPKHEHVYTNGDICLSMLGKHWRPTMTAQSIAVSILSILSSAQSKSIPMDNARHAQTKPGQYQKDWVYHDDNC